MPQSAEFNIPNGRPTGSGWPTPLEVSSTRIKSAIDPDGKNQKQVTSFSNGSIFCATWLPGSRHIVFSRQPRFGPDSADLFSASIEAGEVRRLTLVPNGTFTPCTVSADGKRHAWQPMWTQISRAGMLLFNSPATGIRNLWIMPLVGEAGPRQITFLPNANISHAALSPDGSRVAYVSTESGSGQIWVANVDGFCTQQLSNNSATNLWPFWSHDGQWMAFASMRPGPAEIWKFAASGGTPVQVTHGGGFRGDWSPDGTASFTTNSCCRGAYARVVTGPRWRSPKPPRVRS